MGSSPIPTVRKIDNMCESISITEVYKQYAREVGDEPLTDAEKKQAFMDAVLDGKNVSPFHEYTELMRTHVAYENFIASAILNILGEVPQ
jgi:hypothetical protein